MLGKAFRGQWRVITNPFSWFWLCTICPSTKSKPSFEGIISWLVDASGWWFTRHIPQVIIWFKEDASSLKATNLNQVWSTQLIRGWQWSSQVVGLPTLGQRSAMALWPCTPLRGEQLWWGVPKLQVLRVVTVSFVWMWSLAWSMFCSLFIFPSLRFCDAGKDQILFLVFLHYTDLDRL